MKGPLKKAVSYVLAAALVFCATGCWDRVEINNRYFVLALAVDKFEYSEAEEKKQEEEQQGQNGVQQPAESRRNRLVVSIVAPNVGLLKSEGTIVTEEMKFPLSTVGPNTQEAITQLDTRLNGRIFFGHVKAVLIGERLLKDRKLFMETMDELERDHQIGRNIDFLAVKGEAKDALFIKPLVEPIIGTYLEQIFQQRRTGRFHGRKLGEIITTIHETGGALIPRLTVGENELKVAGACVIKNHKHRAWLGELETRAAQWIDGMAEEGTVSVEMQGIWVPFEMTGLERSMEVTKDDDGNIYLDISLTVEGEIAGYIYQIHREVMDEKFIKEAQTAIGREMTAECTGVMDKVKNEFGVDIWGIGAHIRKFHPEIWRDVKDNWEEVFPDIEVNISVLVNVRRIGIIK
jgi:Ger(x)C family germination protein